MTTTLGLEALAGRCAHGFHIATQRDLCTTCTPSEWATFVTAIRTAVRDDGTVHQADVRPLIKGRVSPKSIGLYYRKARTEHLLSDTGEREQSNDVAGGNSDKLDRIYALVGAA